MQKKQWNKFMFLKKFIGTKEFYKSVMIIVLPIILQNGLNNLVNLLDNIMVGALGTEQMSGVAIVNQLLFVYILCVFGGTAGAGIFTAQFYGSKNNEGVKHSLKFKFYICLALMAIATFIFTFFGKDLIEIFLHEGGETGNIELAFEFAMQYFIIALIAQIPNTITQIYASTLRETEQTFIPMLASLISVVINAGLNYLLIFGKLGLPALGVQGAATATLTARIIECLIVIIWSHTHTKQKPFFKNIFSTFKIPKPIFKDLVKKGSALLLNEALWSGVQTAILSCYSMRGLSSIAAMNINNTFNNLFSIVFFSMGNAIAIIVGNLLGAGKLKEARDADNKIIALSFVCCLFFGGLMALLTPVLVTFYKTTNEVRDIAISLMYIAAFTMPIHSLLHNFYFTLRSGGKTLITFLFDSGFATCVSLPTAFLLAKFTTIPTSGLYLAVMGVEALKLIVGFILVKKGVWINNIVADKNSLQNNIAQEPNASANT